MHKNRQTGKLEKIEYLGSYYLPRQYWGGGWDGDRDCEVVRRENTNNADSVRVKITPAIRAAAAAAGQSLQGYILQAVRTRMEQEGQPLEIEQTPAERCQRDPCRVPRAGGSGAAGTSAGPAPAPISTGKDPPRLDQQQKRKSQSERPAPSALAFLLPTARPDQHREGLPPPRSAPGRTAPPTVTACPICPAWAVSACQMSSGPPARSPARAAHSSRTPPP